MPKITKRSVDALKPSPAGDVFLWDAGDGALKGFGVRLKPSGAASYLVQYRNQEGRTRRLVIGRKGELTPDEARDLAAKRLGEVRKGGDPSAERHALRGAMTVSELCDLYLSEGEGRIKASTLAADRSRIDRHVKPLLGSRAVSGLTSRDLEGFQAEVAARKTAKPRATKGRGGQHTGGPGVAARTLGMLGTILETAKRHGLISINPARGVRKIPDKKRERFLSLDEISALGTAMRDAIRDGENPTGIAAIKALLLTGCRRNEVLALPRSWVDAKASCIRFGDTKSGAQLRSIGSKAAQFLASQSDRDDSPWVFPADHGDGHFVGLPRVLARLCARAGLQEVTIHTLRHSFAAVAAELGFSELIIAGLLGHRLPGITARYAHVPDRALVTAADTVSARIADALEGKTGAEIVSLNSRKAI